MYVVYDGNKPCDCLNHKVHSSWNRSNYPTFIEALNYAHKWLGMYSPGRILKLNTTYDYSGYGDLIEIRKTK